MGDKITPNIKSSNINQKYDTGPTMKRLVINRRDFLQTGLAGTVLAASAMADSSAHASTPRKSVTSAKESQKAVLTEVRKGTLIRSDMSLCTPAENLSRNFEKDHWALIDYETTNGIKGYMVSARPDQDCGTLSLALDAQGVYRIFFGYARDKIALSWGILLRADGG